MYEDPWKDIFDGGSQEKRFYTRGTLRNIRIPWLAKTKPSIVIGSDPWSKKRGNYLSCIEGKGDGKDINKSLQNAALFVDLLVL